MEPSDTLLKGLSRRWPMILLTVALGLAAAFAYTESQPEEYRVTSRLLVGPPTHAGVEILRAAGLMAHTYSDIMTARSSLLDAAEKAGLPPDVEELTELVEVTANENTRLVTLHVQHEDPEAAAAFAAALIDRITAIAPPARPPTLLGATTSIGAVTVIDDASVPPEPVEQPVVLLVVLAGVVAAAIAGTAAVALEAAPWRRPPANLDGLVQRRFLGRFPVPSAGPVAKLTKRRLRRQAGREQRLVMTKLQHLTARRPLRSLAVFGARGDDSSALVAAELASAFARTGLSVVLVDLTGDRVLARRLRPGRRERDIETVDDVVLELAEVAHGGPGRLRVLVSDTLRATEGGPTARPLVEVLGHLADLVVVAAPPMLLEFGTLLVARQTDGAVLVGSEDPASVDGAIEAHDLLSEHDVAVLGTVLTSRHTAVEYPTTAATGSRSPAPPRDWTSPPTEATDRPAGR